MAGFPPLFSAQVVYHHYWLEGHTMFLGYPKKFKHLS